VVRMMFLTFHNCSIFRPLSVIRREGVEQQTSQKTCQLTTIYINELSGEKPG